MSAEPVRTEPVRWGVLGAGTITRLGVGPALAASPVCEVVAIGARDAGRAGQLAVDLGVDARGAGYAEVLSDPTVEVVYVALANDDHVPWVLRALAMGKHVLCEKPLGLHAASVGRAFDAAEAAGRLLVEATWSRWHPRWRAVEALVASGGIGPLRRVDAGFSFTLADEPPNYRHDPVRGGGALYDVGCYALSAVCSAVGTPTVSVERVAVRRSPTGADTMTDATLTCTSPSGETVEAHVHAAFDEPERQWVVLTGDDGEVRLGDQAFTAWRPGDDHGWTLDGARCEVDPVDPYELMVAAVADRARGGDAWVVPRADSQAVASAVDLVRTAAAAAG